MKLFICTCNYGFVIHKRKVIGPFFMDSGGPTPKKMSMDDFSLGYPDCYYRWQLKSKGIA